jgi:hypothetical protein
MEAAIIAAIITSSAAAATAIGTAIYTARSNSKLNQAKQEFKNETDATKKQIQAVTDVLNKRIQESSGFNIGKNYVKVYMQDLEGTCRIIRGWEGVKANLDGDVDKIPGYAQFDTPGSKIVSAPRLTGPIYFPKHVRFSYQMMSDQLCNFKAEIEGKLRHDDPELSFEIEYTVTKAFLMTEEDVVAAYKDEPFEAFGLRGDLPAQKIEIELHFPDGFTADTYPRVSVGYYGVIAVKESDRVRPGFSSRVRGARFVVDDPVPICVYEVQWTPPPAKKSLDASKLIT